MSFKQELSEDNIARRMGFLCKKIIVLHMQINPYAPYCIFVITSKFVEFRRWCGVLCGGCRVGGMEDVGQDMGGWNGGKDMGIDRCVVVFVASTFNTDRSMTIPLPSAS